MSKRVLFGALILCVTGCKGNPYSGVGDRLAVDPVQQKPGTVRQGAIDAPSSIEISEKKPGDKKTAIKITGHVAPPGTPKITIENSPPWCDPWDPATQTVQCAPPIGTGASGDPAHNSVIFKVTVSLTSSTSTVAKITQEMSIIVRHEALGASIDFPDNKLEINEGSSFQGVVSVTSADFPRGPFTISAINLPPGVTIATTPDPSKFYVDYSPNFSTVSAHHKDRQCYDKNLVRHICLTLSWVLNIVDPAGAIQTAKADWLVMDIRQDPKVTVPKSVTAYSVMAGGTETLTADFEVPVEDLNNEVPPKVTIAGTPALGAATVTVVATGDTTPTSNPYSFVHVVWSGVPATAKGSVQVLDLQTCVYDYAQKFKQCTTTPVNVQF